MLKAIFKREINFPHQNLTIALKNAAEFVSCIRLRMDDLSWCRAVPFHPYFDNAELV